MTRTFFSKFKLASNGTVRSFFSEVSFNHWPWSKSVHPNTKPSKMPRWDETLKKWSGYQDQSLMGLYLICTWCTDAYINSPANLKTQFHSSESWHDQPKALDDDNKLFLAVRLRNSSAACVFWPTCLKPNQHIFGALSNLLLFWF